MDVSSSTFNTGLSTIQSGQQRLDTAGQEIAKANIKPNNLELADQMVELLVAQQEVAAGSEVIKAADQTLGSLIDIRV